MEDGRIDKMDEIVSGYSKTIKANYYDFIELAPKYASAILSEPDTSAAEAKERIAAAKRFNKFAQKALLEADASLYDEFGHFSSKPISVSERRSAYLRALKVGLNNNNAFKLRASSFDCLADIYNAIVEAEKRLERLGLEKEERNAEIRQENRIKTNAWTTNDIERFWASVASLATRLVTEPRTGKADAQKAEGILEAFGERYMPNAYSFYGKARAKAIEREQLLKEKFPEGAKSDTTGGGLYQKIARATAKAISEYDRRHDELCHFYLMHKAGIMTDAGLTELDESKIFVMLPLSGEMPEKWKPPAAPKPDELDFARKYKPETFAAYERLKAHYDEGATQYNALCGDMLTLDAVRGGGVLAPLVERLNRISSELQKIVRTLSEENLLHEVEKITAEKLADSDAKFGIEARAFENTLPVRDYAQAWLAKNWTAKEWGAIAIKEAPVFALSRSMVVIADNYSMCKYEVTQALWVAMMGANPSEFKGADRPVENVSWDDCQKFLGKLNAMPEVKESGVTYRLPTEDEWVYACRAGAKDDYCKLADGAVITRDTLGDVAWYSANSDSKTHPVGQKNPNAFGLYDMHGNVAEWVTLFIGHHRLSLSCGGSWRSDVYGCSAGSHKSDSLGFRLAADRAADLTEDLTED